MATIITITDKKTGEVKKILKKRVFAGQKFLDPGKDTIKTYKEVSEVVKTGEGKSDFVIKKKLAVVEEVNRADHINSFSGDVGLQNILKKLAMSGTDVASVVESGRFASKQKGLVDISDMPDNIAEAFREVEKGVKAYDKLPEDLKKKMSFDVFASSFKKEDFEKYIQSQVDKRIVKMQKKVEQQKVEEKGDK